MVNILALKKAWAERDLTKSDRDNVYIIAEQFNLNEEQIEMALDFLGA